VSETGQSGIQLLCFWALSIASTGTSSIDWAQQCRFGGFHLKMQTKSGLRIVVSNKNRMMDNVQKYNVLIYHPRHRLRFFENKVLRRIFGPKTDKVA
jgi:hypothetical protein